MIDELSPLPEEIGDVLRVGNEMILRYHEIADLSRASLIAARRQT